MNCIFFAFANEVAVLASCGCPMEGTDAVEKPGGEEEEGRKDIGMRRGEERRG